MFSRGKKTKEFLRKEAISNSAYSPKRKCSWCKQTNCRHMRALLEWFRGKKEEK